MDTRVSRTARVIIASTRAAAGVYEDRTGPLITAWLAGRGYDAGEPVVVPDGEQVGAALRAAVEDRVSVVLTSGGTGISPSDATPEVTADVVERQIPGLADAIRRAMMPSAASVLRSAQCTVL